MGVSCPRDCELFTNTVGKIVTIECGSGETTLFRSSLSSPADGTFFARITSPVCTVTFTFYQTGNRQFTRTFEPVDIANGTISVVLTVPDVERITLACTLGTTGFTCSVEWGFIYHYCRCCG